MVSKSELQALPKKSQKFLKTLSQLSIEPQEVSLILLTHCHWDHIGSAAEIKTFTGAKLAIHRNGKDWVEKKELKTIPPPATSLWGGLARATTVRLFTVMASYSRTTVDLVLGDEQFSSSDYCIAGEVVYTPGHSSDSVSLLLDAGDAFVGDLAMNAFSMRIGTGMINLKIGSLLWEQNENAWIGVMFRSHIQNIAKANITTNIIPVLIAVASAKICTPIRGPNIPK
ncbi:MAG: MBL fold metallo-hydrolase [Methanophagales archaeon]|nr:MBL fold metallo-hydrolase [Methanophagales archaeon]